MAFGTTFFVVMAVAVSWLFQVSQNQNPPVLPAEEWSIDGDSDIPEIVISGQLQRKQTFSTMLVQNGVSDSDVVTIVETMKPVIDYRKCHVGDSFSVAWSGIDTSLIRFDYVKSPLEKYRMERDSVGFSAYKVHIPIDTVLVPVSGTLVSSLYESVLELGESAELIEPIADIFAWNVDFYADPRTGDQFHVLVEKCYVDSQFVGYGAIQAANYKGEVGDFTVIRFNDSDGRTDYFDEKGRSISSAFIKSPLKFTRISSRYGRRFHPVLKYTRMHRGVDYAAPSGTPVWSVGPGTVIHAGWKGDFGKLIEIRHSNGIVTRYAHLSKIYSGIKQGVKIDTKQLIGAVGSTGLAKGAHLHFEMLKDGKHVNPAQNTFRNYEPVFVQNADAFKLQLAQWKAYFKDDVMVNQPESGDHTLSVAP